MLSKSYREGIAGLYALIVKTVSYRLITYTNPESITDLRFSVFAVSNIGRMADNITSRIID